MDLHKRLVIIFLLFVFFKKSEQHQNMNEINFESVDGKIQFHGDNIINVRASTFDDTVMEGEIGMSVAHILSNTPSFIKLFVDEFTKFDLHDFTSSEIVRLRIIEKILTAYLETFLDQVKSQPENLYDLQYALSHVPDASKKLNSLLVKSGWIKALSEPFNDETVIQMCKMLGKDFDAMLEIFYEMVPIKYRSAMTNFGKKLKEQLNFCFLIDEDKGIPDWAIQTIGVLGMVLAFGCIFFLYFVVLIILSFVYKPFIKKSSSEFQARFL